MPHLVGATLLDNRDLGRNNFLLSFEAVQISAEARPGHFVMAAPESRQVVPSPLLKRALAIYSTGDSQISVLVKVIGEGTARLASMNPGQRADIIGPLGNGFDLEAGKGRVNMLVAGGVGIASVHLLARELRRRGEDVILLYGGRTAADLVLQDDFRELGVLAFVTTDDGAAGVRGFVTAALQEQLKVYSSESLNMYACGPEPMLREVSRIACSRGIPCQVSVEARMACGFGVCLGCSVRTRASYRLACTHGPVFQASEIVWDE